MLGPFSIGGLPVDQIFQEPEAFFRIPLELSYKDQLIQVDPVVFDFQIDISTLENDIRTQMSSLYSGKNFISYLFGKFTLNPINLELITSYNQQKIGDYLEKEIIPDMINPQNPGSRLLMESAFIPANPVTNWMLNLRLHELKSSGFTG